MSITPTASIHNVVIGTAGHIDHGKSTLVKALTEIDPDRLPEEKAREMTIDLGFAPFVLPNGQRVGIIDVPGHERFLKNMVAGASGIDFAILVVDVNEGVMPQTREHLEIMELLGITRGLVALTKCDTADHELIELASEELRDELADSFLAAADIVPVSALSGMGIDDLRATLATACAELRPRDSTGAFRMPIQRVFSAKGFGTVVTGVPLSGQAKPGDILEVVPLGAKGRVRGVQAYHLEVDCGRAGHSQALNLADIDYKSVCRGMVVATPGSCAPTMLISAQLRLLASATRPLEHMDEIRFHVGTAEAYGRVALLEDKQLAPGDSAFVQFRLREPVVALPADHFIVRHPTLGRTLGGGTVLSADTHKLKPQRAFVRERLGCRQEALTDRSALVADVLLAAGLEPLTMEQIQAQAGVEHRALKATVEELSGGGQVVALPRGRLFVHSRSLDAAADQVLAALKGIFGALPLRRYATVLEVRAALKLHEAVFGAALESAVEQGWVDRLADGRLAVAGREVALGARQQGLYHQMLEALRRSRFEPPTASELAQELEITAKEAEALLGLLVDDGLLTQVSGELRFLTDAVAEALALLLEPFRRGEEFSASDYRTQLGTSRKYAIPLLEHFDNLGYTVRKGSSRVLRKSLDEIDQLSAAGGPKP